MEEFDGETRGSSDDDFDDLVEELGLDD